MGKVCLLLSAIAVAGLGLAAQHFWSTTRPLPAPQMKTDEYWGREKGAAAIDDNPAIEAQEIYYSPETIARLHAKLNESLPLHAPLEGMRHAHEYGLNPYTLRQLVDHWRDEYLPRWTERQAFLNSVPHFKTNIQGLSIHFVHIKPAAPVPAGKIVVPMLLLHGWPGSVREFYDLFPLLTQPTDDSPYLFEVVAPSLPGFAWSEAATRTHFGPAEMAVVLRNLMLRIGHERFLVQGGDWGSVLGSHVATLFPQNVIGYHSNYCVMRTMLSTAKLLAASLYPTAFVPQPKHVDWLFPLSVHFTNTLLESGYFHMQATKPDTIGLALTGNPVGLAAWIYEKFVYAYPEHDVTAVLDNLMIYYLTNSAHTAGRIYGEALTIHQNALSMSRVQVPVPTACARFRRDIGFQLDWQLRDKYVNLVQSTWHDVGGHFAAMEVPHALYKDFVDFVGQIDVL